MNDEQKEVNKIEELIKECKNENSMMSLILIATLLNMGEEQINKIKDIKNELEEKEKDGKELV